jgi:Uma2 family endonuclease
MAVDLRPRLSPQDYLALERQAEWKSEYVDGERVAMSGASRRHNLIVLNLARELSLQLKGRPCEAYVTDMRVKAAAGALYTYPDAVVVCGEPRFEDADVDTLLNPTLLIEVLSPNTEAYDRGAKFEHYRTLDSLREYVLIAQDKPRVDHFARQGDGQWLLTPHSGLEGRLPLPAIQCELALAEIYDKVAFG